MTMTQTESVTLYYQEGSSDKVYQARIEPQGDGFVVRFAFGRRGNTLQTGTKTPSPVDYAKAKKAFDKLVKQKMAKGYTPGEDGTPYQHTENQERAIGILPQLLNAITEEEAAKLVPDTDWLAQEKLDGQRVLIRRIDQEITGINRKGLIIALPEPVVQLARKIGSMQWIMDGEMVGDSFHAFDLLENACVDLRNQPYSIRLGTLYPMLPAATGPIRSIPTAALSAHKRNLIERLKAAKKEGVVFKRHDAPYTPGRPASGGSQVKLKFTATASCIVAGPNGDKRSVALELLDGTRRVPVGNLTIPPKVTMPVAGDIVEARYLYAFPGGSLYQPVFLAKRDDVAIEACSVAQLKYKAGGEDE